MAIALNYAIRSDVGLVRSNNQDSGYAGPDLLVVADGMGGHAGGDVASSLAIGELVSLDGEAHGADDALAHLRASLYEAHQQLLQRVREEPTLAGMGTTVTALLRTGNRLALAHIGDSRAYFLRDGKLAQITHDHTFVQTLVDEGRLSPEEAEHHPQRSVLMRVLSDLIEDAEPDLSMREARIGDRYLICSDGLSGVVSFDTLQETLAAGLSPQATCENLVNLALRGGAPDNVTCIVADVVAEHDSSSQVPAVVGAASHHPEIRGLARVNGGVSAAERAAALTQPLPRTPGAEAGDQDDAPDTGPDRPRRGGRLRRLAVRTLVTAVLLGVIAGGAFAAWSWSQTQFFVAPYDGSVAIYRGVSQNLGPIDLSRVERVSNDVPLNDLPVYWRGRVEQAISADGLAQAEGIVQTLREKAAACRRLTGGVVTATAPAPSTDGSPTPSPTGTGTAGGPAAGADGGSGSPSATPSPTTSTTVSPSPAGDDPVEAEDCEGTG